MSNAELVKLRFVEAADVERRLPRVSGPRAGSYWPGYGFDKEERDGWTDQDKAEDRAKWAERRNVTASELSRYGEVIGWTVDHIPAVSMRRLAWTWAFCQAIPGRSFVSACNKNGWAKSTAYNRLERLWDRLAFDLVNASIMLREPRGYTDGQVEASEAIDLIRSGRSDEAPKAVPLTSGFRTEESKDLLTTPEAVADFAKALERRNARMKKIQAWRNEGAA